MKGIEVRAFLLGLVGMALSFYSLNNGQAEWIVGVDGLFGSSNYGRFHSYSVPSGRQVIVGLGVIHSLVSGVLSASLIAGVYASNQLLLLPPLIFTISELVKDVSTSMITTILIHASFGNPLTLVYIIFTSTMTVLNFYLWHGALQVYELISVKEDVSARERREKLPDDSPRIYQKQLDFDKDEPPDTRLLDLPLLEPRKSLVEEFEEFKRMEREKENNEIHVTKNTFIELFSDIDLDLIRS